jgi:cytochrome c biogenesis protein CcdA
MVPSTSAVVLLLAAVNLGRVPAGMLLILLFGTGMAVTLVAVGLILVSAGRRGVGLMARRGHRLEALAGLVTPGAAVLVMVVGAALTVRSLGDVLA